MSPLKCYGMSTRYPASNTLGACPKREGCAHFVPWPADNTARNAGHHFTNGQRPKNGSESCHWKK